MDGTPMGPAGRRTAMGSRAAVVDTVPREARPYQGQRAGIVSRTLANAVDLGVILLVQAGAYVGRALLGYLQRGSRFHLTSASPGTALLTWTVVAFLYFTISWTSTGRTFGDHLLGLRVVNRHGERMRLIPSAIRAAFCTVFIAGLAWCAVSRTNRSVQDIVLRTSVIYDWDPRPLR